VWFAEDARQVPWPRFLDEVAAAGYRWIELGPHGYLPTDPARLRAELDARGLSVSAGTVFTALHRGEAVWEETWAQAARVAGLAAAVGAEYLVVIPSFWRDDRTAELLEPAELDAGQWAALVRGAERLGARMREEFGLRIAVHPHADTHLDTAAHVARFLDATDPRKVALCLDTGHYAYCGGDALALLRSRGERVAYLHLKQVDPAVLADVVARGTPFGPAVAAGVMCEPPRGVPELPPVLAAAQALAESRGPDAALYAVVEQDMYPCAPDAPLPIAARTRAYLRACGA